MAILVDAKTRVLVQGITGREGAARAWLMQRYGTRIVAGVTPGRGGEVTREIPVFDTVQAATEAVGGIDASVIFVPAPQVRDAALEALQAGIRLLVLVADRVPVYDTLEVLEVADRLGARVIGPNTLGIVSPGQALLGMIGGRARLAEEWFRPGPVGVASRSGGMTSALSSGLSRAGIGQSTIVHVGGDGIVGLPLPRVVELFEADPKTEAIVLFGEIGTSQEEEVADLIAAGKVRKPVFAYIGGAAAKSGMRYSHAGALIEGTTGSHAGKVKRLEEVGAVVVKAIEELPAAVRTSLGVGRRLMTENLQWQTGISLAEEGRLYIRGVPLERLIAGARFSEAIFLLLLGRSPSPTEARLVDAILVASIDHGATPPSTLAARTVASTRASFPAAVASGVLAFSDLHGGAIEGCMDLLHELAEKQRTGKPLPEVVEEAVHASRATKRRLLGIGHRIHSKDPRVEALFGVAREQGLGGVYPPILEALQATAERILNTKLPINVDGAIAALLCELQIPAALGNAFFYMARLPGLIAHVYEERTRMRPMRRIHPTDFEYDGPALEEA